MLGRRGMARRCIGAAAPTLCAACGRCRENGAVAARALAKLMRFSVIIATKDRAEHLDRALESLGKQIGAPEFEVVVVDNGSTDATPLVVERARSQQPYELVYVFEERPNRGAARNRGIAV